ncbi:hypothetical protein DFH08DRAFT_956782 [Mycena albidolilacea]|uniref:Uncharacterized protein n=1 Tax=Mycena albidolilacea TaxID=1033008 RepID=A0AAD7A8B0_9AGAR|nr:hypothetical protein DFH08DRAFT_956782 [Mycena albidolilacea]
MFYIPAELVDLIIDNVDAHEDLKSLIPVSRIFLFAGQYRLFRYLTLEARALQLNKSEIHVLLAKTLRLLIGVKGLAISDDEWQFWFWNAWPKEQHVAIGALLSFPTMHSLAMIADVDLKRKVKFGKSCEAKLLVLLDYLPTETPDVHTFLLSPAVNAALPHLHHRILDLLTLLMAHLPSLPRLELLCVTVTANEARYPGEYPANTVAHDALTSIALSPRKAFGRSASWWTASVLVLRS